MNMLKLIINCVSSLLDAVMDQVMAMCQPCIDPTWGLVTFYQIQTRKQIKFHVEFHFGEPRKNMSDQLQTS